MSTVAPTPEPLSAGNAPLPTLEQLPDDLATLKRMILELIATLRQERHDREAVQQRLSLLLQRLYGPRSERFHPDQLLLFAAGVAPEATEPPAEQSAVVPAPEPESVATTRQRRATPHGRRPLPENLPRRPVHHELSAAERICSCGQTRVAIGTESGGEQLDWQPASYFVWQHLIHKYLCPACALQRLETPTAPTAEPAPPTTPTEAPPAAAVGTEPVAAVTPASASAPVSPAVTEPVAAVTPASASALVSPAVTGPSGPVIIAAAKPPMPIAKGLPGPGLLAHFIVSKYHDHVPLYRHERISERHGVLIPRSTSCDWMAACADLLRPLYDLMVTVVLQSQWLHTDDTIVKNLGHDPGATDKGRLWVYYGDRTHPYNVFDFTINRKRDGPQTFLANYQGYLHADAFSGYDALYLPTWHGDEARIIEVACNAHARRKFYEARGSDALRAHQALAYYGQLYDLERAATANGFDDEQRWRMRQDLAVPILDEFATWLRAEQVQVLPKSAMAEAIGYALNNWTALIRHTEAGYLSIDNNVAEREMKRIAIGRKNWLFVGSARGGQTAAVLISFTATCHRLGIEPWAYLQDVLTRLPRTDSEHLAELLPDRWHAARQAATTVPSEASPTVQPPR
jgi:transposase